MKLLAVIALPVALLATLACGDTGEGGDVDVMLSEWEVALDKDSVTKGPIDFTITNEGEEEHEFVLIETDIAAADLPTNDDGSVDEDAPDLDVRQEVEDIESGDRTGRIYELGAGDYVIVCNIVEEEDGEVESHYELGMFAELTVEDE